MTAFDPSGKFVFVANIWRRQCGGFPWRDGALGRGRRTEAHSVGRGIMGAPPLTHPDSLAVRIPRQASSANGASDSERANSYDCHDGDSILTLVWRFDAARGGMEAVC